MTEEHEGFEEVAIRHVAKPNGHGRPLRAPPISAIWADDIQLDLTAGGLIDGLLSQTGITILYGDSGAGKTFVAIDMACHIAIGRPWRGMEVEKGAVIYIAAEAPESIKRRLVAWKKRYDQGQLPVLVVQSPIDLVSGDTAGLIDLVAQTAHNRGRIALIVIDTLAAAMTGNENSGEDMSKFFAACRALGDAGQAHVMIVHHCGKDAARGARGWSGIKATAEQELEVTKRDGIRTISASKVRDGESGASWGFELEVVELGKNRHGCMITTCVPSAVETPRAAEDPRPNGRELTPPVKIVLRELRHAVLERAELLPTSTNIPTKTQGVRESYWRERCYLAGISRGETEDARRKAFNRARDRLVAAGIAGVWGEWAWLC